MKRGEVRGREDTEVEFIQQQQLLRVEGTRGRVVLMMRRRVGYSLDIVHAVAGWSGEYRYGTAEEDGVKRAAEREETREMGRPLVR